MLDRIARRSQSQVKSLKVHFKHAISRKYMSRLRLDRTLRTTIAAIILAAAGNCLLPFIQNPSNAVEISQTNEPERAPDGKIEPVNGKVNLTLTNPTNARLFYQVVGQTTRRSLAARETVTLRELKLPASILFKRQDEGFLQVTLNYVEKGLLEVLFDETNDLGVDRQSLTIRPDGGIFLR